MTASAAAPGTDAACDDIHEGWQLGRESWSFHRQFHDRVGRPAAYREYAGILWQIRRGIAERLGPDVCRATLADGGTIIARFGWRGGARVLLSVRAPDWQPPVAEPVVTHGSPSCAVEMPAAATEPKAGVPASKRSARTTRLTLANRAAANALAARLRIFGVPEDIVRGVRTS